MVTYQVHLGWFSNCYGRESFRICGNIYMGWMPFLSQNQQCQSTEGNSNWLQVNVLCPTQQKIGHFGNVPQANLLAWYGKTKPNTTKAHIHGSKEMYYDTK